MQAGIEGSMMQVSMKRLARMSASEFSQLVLETWDAEYEAAKEEGKCVGDAMLAADDAVEDLEFDREMARRDA